MHTIGQIIETARLEKKYSFEELGEITKIKTTFLESLEKENWETLPPFATVLGFVKSLSGVLGIDEKMAIAVLKRDYSPKEAVINPKPDVSSKKSLGPKLAFGLGIGAVSLLVLGYLLFQYIKFISPPKLDITSPKDGQRVTGNTVLVFGSTDSDAKVVVNNEPVLVDDDGKFSVDIKITNETKEIVITSQSRSGKATTISRKIEIQN